ncbi:hypothetical protein JCM8097_004629 [Rhodosporidiobolus ruineniae]
MTTTAASASLQSLDRAIASGAAPGLVAVAFDHERNFAAAASGVSSVKTQAPMTTDSVLWFASAGKILVSLAALVLVERDSFDLDSHEELVKVVPELGKGYPGSRVWELFDGKDENGAWRFKQAQKGITLRHLLTHTTGFSYEFASEEYAWAYGETKKAGYDLSSIETYQLPRLFEAGEQYKYGGKTAAWPSGRPVELTLYPHLANNAHTCLFIMRKSGLSFRRAIQQLVLSPLNIPLDAVDTFVTPDLAKDAAGIALRTSETTFMPLPVDLPIPQFDDEVPKGRVPVGEAPAWGRLPAWTGILRSFLNGSAPSPGGKPLLSPESWKLSTQDDLAVRGISIQQDPFWTSVDPVLGVTTQKWAVPKKQVKDDSLGWTFLQNLYHRYETDTGHAVGSLEWAGAAGTFYFVDSTNGVGGMISTQLLPFCDPALLKVRDEFAKWVHENVPAKTG